MKLQNLKSPKNYRWVIVLAGMLGLFGALGLGRFSLGVMLPAMGEALRLSYSQMGVISTANFCGYLTAVLMCGPLNRLLGPRKVIFLGLMLTGISMLLIGCSASYIPALFFYVFTGIGSALANIPIMALIVSWFEPALRGRASGICVMGNGLGILVSGKLVPFLNLVDNGWQLSWIVIGCCVVLIALVCFMLIREPSKLNGGNKTIGRTLGEKEKNKPVGLYIAGALYFLFGFTYVIYITFLVTSIIQDRGISEQFAGSLWAAGGLISIISGPLFGFISDHKGRKNTLVLVFFLQTLAYLLAAWTDVALSIYFSILFFSLVAFSVPTVMAAMVGDIAGPANAASWFGLITFFFGIGQIVGPAVAGSVAEKVGNFSPSFLIAAAMTATAVFLSLLFTRDSVEKKIKRDCS